MRNFRTLFYQLKKDWGTKIRYVQLFSAETDDDSGVTREVRTAYELPAVRLPQRMLRQFVQDIGYLAANKNFTYGGFNDYDQVAFLIQAKDFPPTIDKNLNGWINFGGMKYERSRIDDLGGFGFLILGKAIVGGNTYDTVELRAGSFLQMQQTVVMEQN